MIEQIERGRKKKKLKEKIRKIKEIDIKSEKLMYWLLSIVTSHFFYFGIPSPVKDFTFI